MDRVDADALVKQLTVGFDALREEYGKLYGRHQVLERKLATAREQYNELAKLYGSGTSTTPPLSLSSASGQRQDVNESSSAAEILAQQKDQSSRDAAERVDIAYKAALALRDGIPNLRDASANGVKIWAGPSADKVDISSSAMPSISESPLEQDFTIEGKPSSLGCPFASMARKKLSSHAASVLSRYDPGSTGARSVSNSSVNRVNGRESYSRRASRRASFADPIKEEICGLSEHDEKDEPVTQIQAEGPDGEQTTQEAVEDVENAENAEPGVCPIRFLDQHSPEEVATYFERHKHELPRSHEICVRRYQSNEEQIRELDAKYGNLVSMIQGLGNSHKGYLPDDPDPEEEEKSNVVDDAKVRKWASSVSPQRPEVEGEEDDEYDGRLQHFERPLREVRVGESPSRPWGISVPAKYYDKEKSGGNSRAASLAGGDEMPPQGVDSPKAERAAPGRCPFGFDQAGGGPPSQKPGLKGQETKPAPSMPSRKPSVIPKPAEAVHNMHGATAKAASQPAPITFAGPVFIGYSPEDAAKFLQMSGLGEGPS